MSVRTFQNRVSILRENFKLAIALVTSGPSYLLGPTLFQKLNWPEKVIKYCYYYASNYYLKRYYFVFQEDQNNNRIYSEDNKKVYIGPNTSDSRTVFI